MSSKIGFGSVSPKWIGLQALSLGMVALLSLAASAPAFAEKSAAIYVTPVPTAGVDGTLTQTVDRPNARPGDVVAFAFTASNPNEQHIPEVTVKDTLPAGLEFVDASTSQGSYVYDPASRLVTVSLWQMEAGATASVVVRARVSKTAAPGASLRNTGTINGLLSNDVDVLVIPSSFPDAGEPLSQSLTLGALALVALVLAGAPLAGRAFARSR